MRKKIVAAVVLTVLAAACIHVVVNVYFPESEAKGALATLEDELLKEPVPANTPKNQPEKPAPKKDGSTLSKSKPARQSRVIGLSESLNAHAAERVTEQELYRRIKAMPHVVEAYERMEARLARVNALRDSGAVGEGNDGLLHPRKPLNDRRAQRTVDDENADRSKVIRGLAKAVLRAQGITVNRENLDNVLPKAAETFAALRRSKAHSGWWVQTSNGTWKRKGGK